MSKSLKKATQNCFIGINQRGNTEIENVHHYSEYCMKVNLTSASFMAFKSNYQGRKSQASDVAHLSYGRFFTSWSRIYAYVKNGITTFFIFSWHRLKPRGSLMRHFKILPSWTCVIFSANNWFAWGWFHHHRWCISSNIIYRSEASASRLISTKDCCHLARRTDDRSWHYILCT